jgi:hypothetical protein
MNNLSEVQVVPELGALLDPVKVVVVELKLE